MSKISLVTAALRARTIIMGSTAKHTYAYARPAVTVDAGLVSVEGCPHVLLVKRRNDPFKGFVPSPTSLAHSLTRSPVHSSTRLLPHSPGKWAFPGGFVDANENISTAVYRELQEETSIDLLGEHRRHAVTPLQQVRTFGDDINRDPRGWCVTILYGALVDPAVKDHTKAADDAAEAEWFPLSSPPLAEMAFDHDAMIRRLAMACAGEGEWSHQRGVPDEVSAALRRASRVLDPAFTGGAKPPTTG